MTSDSRNTAAAASGGAKAQVHRARSTGAAVRTEVTTKPSMSHTADGSTVSRETKLPPLRFQKSDKGAADS